MNINTAFAFKEKERIESWAEAHLCSYWRTLASGGICWQSFCTALKEALWFLTQL